MLYSNCSGGVLLFAQSNRLNKALWFVIKYNYLNRCILNTTYKIISYVYANFDMRCNQVIINNSQIKHNSINAKTKRQKRVIIMNKKKKSERRTAQPMRTRLKRIRRAARQYGRQNACVHPGCIVGLKSSALQPFSLNRLPRLGARRRTAAARTAQNGSRGHTGLVTRRRNEEQKGKLCSGEAVSGRGQCGACGSVCVCVRASVWLCAGIPVTMNNGGVVHVKKGGRGSLCSPLFSRLASRRALPGTSRFFFSFRPNCCTFPALVLALRRAVFNPSGGRIEIEAVFHFRPARERSLSRVISFLGVQSSASPVVF